MGELTQLGCYEIIRVRGSGAMGVVYEAIDSKLYRRVAIKTIIKSAMGDAAQAADCSERFMREAQSIARLNHPNIVTVLDFGEEGDIAYFVMEFVQGRELKEFLDGSLQFPLHKSLNYVVDLLGALDYAHSQGIVHRDIKPANIMIDNSGRLKLTGFGVVQVLDKREGTNAGTLVGPPGCMYMSPEQIFGTPASPRSDIFAAGVVLYQLLTGKTPYTGDGVFTIQQTIATEAHALPSALNSGLSPELGRIVGRALAKKPEDRYTRASEFAEAIKRFLAGAALAGITLAQEDEKAITVPAIDENGGVAEKDIAAPAGHSAEKTIFTAGDGNDEPVTEMEKYLAQRENLETAFEGNFHKFITVMFTDLEGSTTIAEKEGDIVSSMLIKSQSDILLPAIREHHGVYVTSIGGCSLSYFPEALDAVRAAARIQKDMDALNMSKKFKFPVLMRIGMHSGCMVEEDDIYGDVVKTASRFESAADPGGILMSEDTYNALSDKSEIHCRFVKQVTLKGKQDPFNAYKAFWNPREIELDKQGQNALPRQEYAVPARSSGRNLILAVGALIGIVLLLTLGSKFFGSAQPDAGRRSISDTVAPATPPDMP